MHTFFVHCLCLFLSPNFAVHLPPIHWDSRNFLFSNKNGESNNDEREIVSKAKIRDILEIHCPFYDENVIVDEAEFGIINVSDVPFQVTKYGYDNCVLDHAKPVIQCVNPFTETVAKVTIREFTPLPQGLEFKSGETRLAWKALQATSTGSINGLHNAQGGLCSNKNMKMKLVIEPETTPITIGPPSFFDSNNKSDYDSLTTDGILTDYKLNHQTAEIDRFEKVEEVKKETIVEIEKNTVDETVVGNREQYYRKNDEKERYIYLPYSDATRNPNSKFEDDKELTLYEVHEISDFVSEQRYSSAEVQSLSLLLQYCTLLLLLLLLPKML
uniref:Ephrin RBD domain-containing protein n=1 Tax=Romanomermis culicivorax TaxID=13658 RepID=A0A915HYY7_ROMCU